MTGQLEIPERLQKLFGTQSVVRLGHRAQQMNKLPRKPQETTRTFGNSCGEAAGLTQTAVAHRLGEYQSFVARLESGQRRVDVVEFLEIADILGFGPAKAVLALKRLR